MSIGALLNRTRQVATRVVISLMMASVATLTLGALHGGVANAATRSITLTDSSKGHLYYLYPGDKVTIVLHSTYWKFTPISGPEYIAQVGAVRTVASPPSTAGCVVGQGCGTVTIHYVAKALGAMRIIATRTSCGEALRCTPSNSRWSVIFKVY